VTLAGSWGGAQQLGSSITIDSFVAVAVTGVRSYFVRSISHSEPWGSWSIRPGVWYAGKYFVSMAIGSPSANRSR
jgi:hypothetical protein